MTPLPPPAAGSDRLTLIDGLRGIAASAVALHHFWNNGFFDDGRLRELMPPAGNWLLRHGSLGVVIFFALSGYVITHSLAAGRLTPGRAGNFVLRRSVRLDPPYFVTILLVIVANAASNRFLPERYVPLPSPGKVLAHLVYLQELLGYGSLLGVFWTLCLEVQLYLTYAAALTTAHAVVRGDDPRRLGRAVVWILTPIAIGSLYWPLSGLPEEPRSGWMFMYWYLFLLGALARWCETDRLAYLGFAVLLVGAATAAVIYGDERAAAGVLTAVVIRTAAVTGQLKTALNWRWLQFLGTISYSLYLLHDVFGVKILNICTRITGRGLAVELGVLALTLTISLLTAYSLYRLVERPFVRISRRFKPKPSTARHPS